MEMLRERERRRLLANVKAPSASVTPSHYPFTEIRPRPLTSRSTPRTMTRRSRHLAGPACQWAALPCTSRGVRVERRSWTEEWDPHLRELAGRCHFREDASGGTRGRIRRPGVSPYETNSCCAQETCTNGCVGFRRLRVGPEFRRASVSWIVGHRFVCTTCEGVGFCPWVYRWSRSLAGGNPKKSRCNYSSFLMLLSASVLSGLMNFIYNIYLNDRVYLFLSLVFKLYCKNLKFT